MSRVILYSVSSTGADEGHRFAAFRMVRSFGMTNWSRTAAQNFSSGEDGVGGSLASLAHESSGVTNGVAPLKASRRAKSRRFMRPPGNARDSTPARRPRGAEMRGISPSDSDPERPRLRT